MSPTERPFPDLFCKSLPYSLPVPLPCFNFLLQFHLKGILMHILDLPALVGGIETPEARAASASSQVYLQHPGECLTLVDT